MFGSCCLRRFVVCLLPSRHVADPLCDLRHDAIIFAPGDLNRAAETATSVPRAQGARCGMTKSCCMLEGIGGGGGRQARLRGAGPCGKLDACVSTGGRGGEVTPD